MSHAPAMWLVVVPRAQFVLSGDAHKLLRSLPARSSWHPCEVFHHSPATSWASVPHSHPSRTSHETRTPPSIKHAKSPPQYNEVWCWKRHSPVGDDGRVLFWNDASQGMKLWEHMHGEDIITCCSVVQSQAGVCVCRLRLRRPALSRSETEAHPPQGCSLPPHLPRSAFPLFIRGVSHQLQIIRVNNIVLYRIHIHQNRIEVKNVRLCFVDPHFSPVWYDPLLQSQ